MMTHGTCIFVVVDFAAAFLRRREDRVSAERANPQGESVRGPMVWVPGREFLRIEGCSSGTNISRQSIQIRTSVLRTELDRGSEW